jgi:hypothetical protein
LIFDLLNIYLQQEIVPEIMVWFTWKVGRSFCYLKGLPEFFYQLVDKLVIVQFSVLDLQEIIFFGKWI